MFFLIRLVILGFEQFLQGHFLQNVQAYIVHRREHQLKIQALKHLAFLFQNRLNSHLFMRDFLVNYLKLNRVNLLILAGHKNASHSHQVQLTYRQTLLRNVEVLIHESHCEKEGLISAFVGGKDFNHPIDHFSPQIRLNLMVF